MTLFIHLCNSRHSLAIVLFADSYLPSTNLLTPIVDPCQKSSSSTRTYPPTRWRFQVSSYSPSNLPSMSFLTSKPCYPVEIKHAGKQHNVEYNPVGDAKAFKESIYQVTGVPTGRSSEMSLNPVRIANVDEDGSDRRSNEGHGKGRYP